MRSNISGRLSSTTPYFNSLIEEIKKGETKIPKFQRPFVWKEEQALALLDSIANSYPIGSLLIWRTEERLDTERQFGEFILPETDDKSPTNYVLDGQQRLTVVYSCLGAQESDRGFAAVYDLINEDFKKLDLTTLGIHIFPLRKLFKTTELLNFRTALQSHPNAAELQQRLDGIVEAFTKYLIPVVTLKDLSVDEVCPIFERINSSGTKLSTYDLMVAATWSKNFDLDDQISDIQSGLLPKGFGEIEKTTVLKCLSAVQLGTVKEKSLKSLRELDAQALDELTASTKQALLKTVDLLSTQFKIHSWDFLSYEAIAVILCHLFAKTKYLNGEQISRIKQWFWRSSFSERYKVGGESFVSTDLNTVSEFVLSGNGVSEEFGRPPTVSEWKSVNFRINSSRSRAFVLALASKNPRSIFNGITIDTAEALSGFNKKQYHHIYPKNFLKLSNPHAEENLLLNICMLPAGANIKISDQNPNVYLPICLDNLGTNTKAVLDSNLFPTSDDIDYSSLKYEEFISARADLLNSLANELCKGS